MKTRFGRACLAGFLGTIVVTCMVTFASPYMIGGPSDIAAMLASLIGGSWLAGMVMHFTVGTFLLPVFYVACLDRRLPGGPALRGIAWGLMLWIVSQAIVIPATGGGFFSAAAGGMRVVADSLIGHLAYGLVVGVLAGRPNELAFAVRHEQEIEQRMRRAA
ncbi:MAG TPA: DUF6789 family protein [Candidatus Eisenbacteria bacterium]|nr:DUF6789 family protein [Candidatus Eisenbacteria bacterium]